MINPPYRLDPLQKIVGASWGKGYTGATHMIITCGLFEGTSYFDATFMRIFPSSLAERQHNAQLMKAVGTIAEGWEFLTPSRMSLNKGVKVPEGFGGFMWPATGEPNGDWMPYPPDTYQNTAMEEGAWTQYVRGGPGKPDALLVNLIEIGKSFPLFPAQPFVPKRPGHPPIPARPAIGDNTFSCTCWLPNLSHHPGTGGIRRVNVKLYGGKAKYNQRPDSQTIDSGGPDGGKLLFEKTTDLFGLFPSVKMFYPGFSDIIDFLDYQQGTVQYG